MNAILLGTNSDLGRDIGQRLRTDGWQVWGWARGYTTGLYPDWNLLVCALGQVSPIGHWDTQIDTDTWDACFEANLFLPLKLLKDLWDRRAKDATVCFLAGSNPNRIMPGYTAYNISKMALLKAVEQLDAETQDCKLFALGPGYVPTKIHRATHDAHWQNDVIEHGVQTNSLERIYECLKWAISAPKEVIGGRNLCASDQFGDELAFRLKGNPNLYKLRRSE